VAPQWGWTHDQEDPTAMALGERIRTLRKEAGWSQAELGEKIGTDGGRVSRYEAGRITPSAEALIRLAENFNVSIDHLLIDDIPRRALHTPENALGDQLANIAELAPDDLAALRNIIDALIAKTRLRALAGGAS
jgi:transcriptional regulator with XRE-family HTH domain